MQSTEERLRGEADTPRGDPSPGPFWLLAIAVVTVASFLVAVLSLEHGIFEVPSSLFFLPLVLIAYFYPRWGVVSSLLLGGTLILLSWTFMRGDLLTLSRTLLVAAVFIGIGGLVSILSDSISGLHKRYLRIFDMSEAGILVVGDRGCRVLESNPGVERLLGYTAADLRDRPFCAIWRDEESCRAFVEEIRGGGHVGNRQAVMRTRDGEPHHVLVSGRRFLGDSFLVTLAGIHQQVVAREMLRKNEARYRQLVETAREGILVYGRDCRILLANESMARMLGYTVGELTGMRIVDLLHPGDRDVPAAIWSGPAHRGGGQAELRFVDRGGNLIVAQASYSLFSPGEDQPDGVLLLVTDITQRKEDEERLRRSLREKEILLREIHHRVKNNMQVISSFLELAAQRTGDAKARSVFAETQGRVRTMALVHENLYRSHREGQVNVRDFFHDLSSEILSSMALGFEPRVVLEVEDMTLDIDRAVPCGLIVNELFTNALKYAFRGRESGIIRIACCEEPPGFCTLRFSDDGVGLPEGFSPGTGETLGMQLVSFLSLQLNGDLSVETGGGTRFTLVFPLAGRQPDRRAREGARGDSPGNGR